eukprot:5235709-Amphidinium_carterae.1
MHTDLLHMQKRQVKQRELLLLEQQQTEAIPPKEMQVMQRCVFVLQRFLLCWNFREAAIGQMELGFS